MVVICAEMSERLTDCSQTWIIEQSLGTIKAVPNDEICRRAFKRGVIGVLTFGGMNLEPVVTKVPVRVCGDSIGEISQSWLIVQLLAIKYDLYGIRLQSRQVDIEVVSRTRRFEKKLKE